MSSPRVTLLLVDDQEIVRMGLRSLFGAVSDVLIVGEAGTQVEAIREARRSQPDVVLMDVRLPDGSGVEACRAIRAERPATRVLMLTAFPDHEAVIASLMAGASGYLLKETTPEQLIYSVAFVARGGSLFCPSAADAVLAWLREQAARPATDPFATLSEHERRILPLIADGKTNRQIAAELSFSEHTVKTYVGNVLRKLGLARRAQAAALYVRETRLPGG